MTLFHSSTMYVLIESIELSIYLKLFIVDIIKNSRIVDFAMMYM